MRTSSTLARRRRIFGVMVAMLLGLAALAAPVSATASSTSTQAAIAAFHATAKVHGTGQGPAHKVFPNYTVKEADGTTLTVSSGLDVTRTSAAAINKAAGRAVVPAAASASFCDTALMWVAGWIGGNKAFQYNQQDNWCGDGWLVTYQQAPANIWGNVWNWAHAIGWEYQGIVSQSTYWYDTSHTTVVSWTQGHFEYCPTWCSAGHYPILELDLYGNDHYSYYQSLD